MNYEPGIIIVLVILFIVLMVIFNNSESKLEEPQRLITTPKRQAIKITRIFNRYEVTELNYYGLCGFTKHEVDVCVGRATFDNYNVLNVISTSSEYFTYVMPSNYKLIKESFVKDESGEYEI